MRREDDFGGEKVFGRICVGRDGTDLLVVVQAVGDSLFNVFELIVLIDNLTVPFQGNAAEVSVLRSEFFFLFQGGFHEWIDGKKDDGWYQQDGKGVNEELSGSAVDGFVAVSQACPYQNDDGNAEHDADGRIEWKVGIRHVINHTVHGGPDSSFDRARIRDRMYVVRSLHLESKRRMTFICFFY